MEYFPKGLLSQAHSLNVNGLHKLYLYNEAGMRIYKQSGGIGVPGESFYLISAGGVMYSIEETQFHSNGNGNSTMERYNIPDLGYEDQNKEINYQIQDHLGNLRLSYTVLHCPSCSEQNCASVDVQYQINYIAEYLAYGGLLREFVRNGTAGEKYLSTGHERDKQTSWDYRQARYYDADLGRFLAVDPLASYVPCWSPYRYAFDNPISITDPTGLFETKGDAREWAKANGHRIGWFSQYKFEKSESGVWDVVNRKDGVIYGKARTEEEMLLSTIDKHGVYSQPLEFAFKSSIASTQSKGERLLSPQGQGGGVPNWVGTTIGVADATAGYFETAFTVQSGHTLRYGQRVNGVVRSANTLTRVNRISSLSTARTFSRASTGLTILSAGVTVVDGLTNDNGWQNYHTVDLLVTGAIYGTAAAFPVVGWVAGGLYFAADLTTQYYTGKSITQNLFDQ